MYLYIFYVNQIFLIFFIKLYNQREDEIDIFVEFIEKNTPKYKKNITPCIYS